jgi:hypothetical protein
MSEEQVNTTEENTAESVNQPLASEGDIAVWGKTMPKSGDEVYVISHGPKGNRSYATLYPEVNGYRMSPDEALALYQGYDIEATLTSKAGKPYDTLLALEGIVTTQNKGQDGKTYNNTTARVGIALLRTSKEGEHLGYRINHKGKSVDFFKTAGPKDNEVELSARACFQLLNNEVIEVDGVELKLGEIAEVNKNGTTYNTARVWGNVLNQEEAESETTGISV